MTLCLVNYGLLNNGKRDCYLAYSLNLDFEVLFFGGEV